MHLFPQFLPSKSKVPWGKYDIYGRHVKATTISDVTVRFSFYVKTFSKSWIPGNGCNRNKTFYHIDRWMRVTGTKTLKIRHSVHKKNEMVCQVHNAPLRVQRMKGQRWLLKYTEMHWATRHGINVYYLKTTSIKDAFHLLYPYGPRDNSFILAIHTWASVIHM